MSMNGSGVNAWIDSRGSSRTRGRRSHETGDEDHRTGTHAHHSSVSARDIRWVARSHVSRNSLERSREARSRSQSGWPVLLALCQRSRRPKAPLRTLHDPRSSIEGPIHVDVAPHARSRIARDRDLSEKGREHTPDSSSREPAGRRVRTRSRARLGIPADAICGSIPAHREAKSGRPDAIGLAEITEVYT